MSFANKKLVGRTVLACDRTGSKKEDKEGPICHELRE